MELTGDPIEVLLTRTGEALAPDRARLRAVLAHAPRVSVREPARSTLSPYLSLTFFMNTTSKVFVSLAVVLVVAGAGVYLSGSSNSGSPLPSGAQGTTPDQDTSMQQQDVAPLVAASGVPAIDDVTSALQAGVNDQSGALSALDSSASQVVGSVDTGDSSAQPYDASQI